jgi:hypothetical protein
VGSSSVSGMPEWYPKKVDSDKTIGSFAIVKIKDNQRSDFIKLDCHLLAGMNVVRLDDQSA